MQTKFRFYIELTDKLILLLLFYLLKLWILITLICLNFKNIAKYKISKYQKILIKNIKIFLIFYEFGENWKEHNLIQSTNNKIYSLKFFLK